MKKCKNCGFVNEDVSVYCSSCGTLLDDKNSEITEQAVEEETAPPVREEAYNQTSTDNNYQFKNTMNNQWQAPPTQSYPRSAEPLSKPRSKKGKVIAALVLSFLCGSIIGLIFAFIALFAYGDYESAVARGDNSLANLKCEKINKYSKIAWIFTIIGLIFIFLIYIAIFGFSFYLVNNPDVAERLEDFADIQIEDYDTFEDIMGSIGDDDSGAFIYDEEEGIIISDAVEL